MLNEYNVVENKSENEDNIKNGECQVYLISTNNQHFCLHHLHFCGSSKFNT